MATIWSINLPVKFLKGSFSLSSDILPKSSFEKNANIVRHLPDLSTVSTYYFPTTFLSLGPI